MYDGFQDSTVCFCCFCFRYKPCLVWENQIPHKIIGYWFLKLQPCLASRVLAGFNFIWSYFWRFHCCVGWGIHTALRIAGWCNDFLFLVSDFILKWCELIASTEPVIGILSKVVHIFLHNISNKKNGLLHGYRMSLFIIIVSFIIDDDSRHGCSSATNTTYCYSIPLTYLLKTKEMCAFSLVKNQSASIRKLWLWLLLCGILVVVLLAFLWCLML